MKKWLAFWVIMAILIGVTIARAQGTISVTSTKWATFSKVQDAKEYKKQMQMTLDQSKGSYLGPPWKQVCIVPVFDGTFAVPLPIEKTKDIPVTKIGKIVETLPVQVVDIEPVESVEPVAPIKGK